VSRHCSVCDHPERDDIDRALALEAGAIRDVAGRFALARSSVFRHAVAHIPATLAQAVEIEQVCRAERLLLDLLSLRENVASAIERADGTDDAALLRAVAEARKLIETFAKVAGVIETRVTVNLTASPEWTALVGLVLDALDPYPPARNAVVAALDRAVS
jgi:hypothetical protein